MRTYDDDKQTRCALYDHQGLQIVRNGDDVFFDAHTSVSSFSDEEDDDNYEVGDKTKNGEQTMVLSSLLFGENKKNLSPGQNYRGILKIKQRKSVSHSALIKEPEEYQTLDGSEQAAASTAYSSSSSTSAARRRNVVRFAMDLDNDGREKGALSSHHDQKEARDQCRHDDDNNFIGKSRRSTSWLPLQSLFFESQLFVTRTNNSQSNPSSCFTKKVQKKIKGALPRQRTPTMYY